MIGWSCRRFAALISIQIVINIQWIHRVTMKYFLFFFFFSSIEHLKLFLEYSIENPLRICLNKFLCLVCIFTDIIYEWGFSFEWQLFIEHKIKVLKNEGIVHAIDQKQKQKTTHKITMQRKTNENRNILK